MKRGSIGSISEEFHGHMGREGSPRLCVRRGDMGLDIPMLYTYRNFQDRQLLETCNRSSVILRKEATRTGFVLEQAHGAGTTVLRDFVLWITQTAVVPGRG